MTWPNNQNTWPGRVERVQVLFLKIIQLLSNNEQINLLVDNRKVGQEVLRALGPIIGSRTRYHMVPTIDAWIRDYGPNFLIQDGTSQVTSRFNHWYFNAWGNKYPNLEQDGKIPAKLDHALDMPHFLPGLVLEGGSFDVNGQGDCLVTEQCLLNPNRNPDWSRKEIENCLMQHLGVRQLIWLGEGLSGDDTDGHVDNLARFTSPNTIVCAEEVDPSEENQRPLKDNLRRLRMAKKQDGNPYHIVAIPLPLPLANCNGRLPASYINFYIANKLVLVPAFGSLRDQQARKTLQSLFPQHRVVSLDCRDLIWGLGGIHCVTLQQPRA